MGDVRAQQPPDGEETAMSDRIKRIKELQGQGLTLREAVNIANVEMPRTPEHDALVASVANAQPAETEQDASLTEITGDDLATIQRTMHVICVSMLNKAAQEIDKGPEHILCAAKIMAAYAPINATLAKIEKILDGGQTVVVTPF